MINLSEFIIKDVRCFYDEQRANIRPITLLVGENSTGKTSFMGSYRVLRQAISIDDAFRILRPNSIDFNSEPFQMGAFRDVVRARRGKSGRIAEFVLGCKVENEHQNYDIFLTFTEKGTEPAFSSLSFEFSPTVYLKIHVIADETKGIEISDGNKTTKTGFRFPAHIPIFFVVNDLFRWFGSKDSHEMLSIKKEDADEVMSAMKYIYDNFLKKPSARKNRSSRRFYGSSLFPVLKQVKSIAPLRSKPRRTYDPITESPTSEGEHIPMLMMRLLRTKDKAWNTLHDDLVAFGEQSGLFSEIKIKSHGKQINDPFQLQVKVRNGPESNIVDVGYGINQLLPILVEIIHSDSTTFLMQQPEVHLHPRGQAEFATFLVKSAVKKKHSFLIETHSDYIIDRVRVSVRNKIIKPEDVSILYFEPTGNGGAVKIHNIEVDSRGQVVNAPHGYRNFFTNEMNNVLGFE